MSRFIPGGPKRYPHQIRGLKKLIETAGVGALLFDPGLGKTATTLDFMSILALKKRPNAEGVQEARVLVISPLAAVDTWVKQADLWLSPEIDFWAEALGGSIIQRATALAARGGQPYGPRALQTMLKTKDAPRKRWRTVNGVKQEEPARAFGWQQAIDWSARSASRQEVILGSDGPDGVGSVKPRLVIEVLNFDTFSRRDRVGSKTTADIMLESVRRFNPDLVVIDESHKIKGATSNVSKLMDRIGQNVPRRIILTGTVMPSGPMDVFGQWRFLDPYAFGTPQPDGSVNKMTLDSFKGRFAVMGGYLGHEVVGYRNLDELQNIMARRAAVAKKADELDLPPVIVTEVPVMLSPREKNAYNDMKKDLAVQVSQNVTASSTNRLTQMMRLRQITAGHLPDDQGNILTLGTSKVDTITSLVSDQLAGQNRVVVFCLFRHEFHSIVDALRKREKAGATIFGIEGETSNTERLRMRAEFGNRSDKRRIILVAQIKTMSIAVNELVTASNVIFGSLSQQRDDLIQAIDRLNRIGQEGESVNVYFVEAPGTVDTVIRQSHNDRTDLEAAVLQHILGEAGQEDRQHLPIQAMSEEGARTSSSHAVPVAVPDQLKTERRTAAPSQKPQAPRADPRFSGLGGTSTFNVVDASEGRPPWTDNPPVVDPRFPGLTSMTPAAVQEAVGTFVSEDPERNLASDLQTVPADDDDVVDLTGY